MDIHDQSHAFEMPAEFFESLSQHTIVRVEPNMTHIRLKVGGMYSLQYAKM